MGYNCAFGVGALCAAAFVPSPVFSQASADDANKSNNPLNLAASFNLQNYYTPSVFGASAHTNDLLLRPTVPLGPNSLIGVPQIFRGTFSMLSLKRVGIQAWIAGLALIVLPCLQAAAQTSAPATAANCARRPTRTPTRAVRLAEAARPDAVPQE